MLFYCTQQCEFTHKLPVLTQAYDTMIFMWSRIKRKIRNRIRGRAYIHDTREDEKIYNNDQEPQTSMYEQGIQDNKNLIEEQTSLEDSSNRDFIAKIIYNATIREKFCKSQHHQDCFVEGFLNHVRKGLCVEIGASDGLVLSNSFFLERALGWKCLLIEGCPKFWEKLAQNRPQSLIETICISSEEGEMDFMLGGADLLLSGIKKHFTRQHLKRKDFGERNKTNILRVPSLRFETVFKKHNITHIDYLSLDTENGEFDCLKSIDFNAVHISLLGVEISYHEKQFEPIYKLLASHGYKYVRRIEEDCFFYKAPTKL